MAKAAPDAMIDPSLDYVAASDRLFVCSAQPATYAEASSTHALADVTLTPGDGNGDFTVGDGVVSGRKVAVTAQAAVPVGTGGTATHLALGLSSDTSLRFVTTATATTLSGGGTIDIPAFNIEIRDPS